MILTLKGIVKICPRLITKRHYIVSLKQIKVHTCVSRECMICTPRYLNNQGNIGYQNMLYFQLTFTLTIQWLLPRLTMPSAE